MGLSNVAKVNIGWVSLIVAGIGSFVVAKSSVLSQRQKNMKKQQDIVDEIKVSRS
jgi:hypothetical protein